MKGWTGNILRIDMSGKKAMHETFDQKFAEKWVGGRGFATKLLWDELEPSIDPLSSKNKLIIALGPISGIPAPNTGKVVIAAKSPITGGYCDGNIHSVNRSFRSHLQCSSAISWRLSLVAIPH